MLRLLLLVHTVQMVVDICSNTTDRLFIYDGNNDTDNAGINYNRSNLGIYTDPVDNKHFYIYNDNSFSTLCHSLSFKTGNTYFLYSQHFKRRSYNWIFNIQFYNFNCIWSYKNRNKRYCGF